MSLNKGIKHKKEKRKEYSGAKAVDKTCRNHGSCDWCKSNRLIRALKEDERCDCEELMFIREYYNTSNTEDSIQHKEEDAQ